MGKQKILVVDDDEDILELVEYNLLKNGFSVITVTSGEDALAFVRGEIPDLVVLDLMLPGMDGLSVCKNLKSAPLTANVPVLCLTAKGEEPDIVRGLDIGGDDYMVKPFSPRVLVARVKALLRRAAPPPAASGEGAVSIHGISLDPGRHLVKAGDQAVELTHAEFRLLELMMRRPGWVFSRDKIIDQVHGEGHAVTDRSVDVLVSGLRKKLGDPGKLIETVRGVGYRLAETDGKDS